MRPLPRFVALCLAILLVVPKSGISQRCGAGAMAARAAQPACTHQHPAPGGTHHPPCEPGDCVTMTACHVAVVVPEPTTPGSTSIPCATTVWPAAALFPPIPSASPEPPPPRA